MADNQKLTPVSPRGRGRPKVDQPRTVTLSIRLKTGEYDALCKRASAADAKLSEVGRTAIRWFLVHE